MKQGSCSQLRKYNTPFKLVPSVLLQTRSESTRGPSIQIFQHSKMIYFQATAMGTLSYIGHDHHFYSSQVFEEMLGPNVFLQIPANCRMMESKLNKDLHENNIKHCIHHSTYKIIVPSTWIFISLP